MQRGELHDITKLGSNENNIGVGHSIFAVTLLIGLVRSLYPQRVLPRLLALKQDHDCYN